MDLAIDFFGAATLEASAESGVDLRDYGQKNDTGSSSAIDAHRTRQLTAVMHAPASFSSHLAACEELRESLLLGFLAIIGRAVGKALLDRAPCGNSFEGIHDELERSRNADFSGHRAIKSNWGQIDALWYNSSRRTNINRH